MPLAGDLAKEYELFKASPSDWGLALIRRCVATSQRSWALSWPEGIAGTRRELGIPAHEIVTIDGHDRVAAVDGISMSVHEAFEALRDGGSRHVVISGHAEGGHADLGEAVLCGLLGAREVDDAGSVVRDGCTRHRGCKRQRDVGTVVYFDDLQADHLVLLGCNTLSAPGAFYSVNPHLTSAALAESGSETVTVVAGNLIIDSAVARWMADGLRQGMHPTTLVADLNSMLGIDGEFGFATFARTPAAAAPSSTARPRSEIAIDGDLRTAAVLDVQSTRPGLYVAARTESHAITNHRPPVDAQLIDVTEVVDRDADWLRHSMLALPTAASVERTLARARQQDLISDPAIRERFQALAKARVSVDSAIAAATHELLLSRSRGALTAHATTALARIQDGWDAWAAALAELHPTVASAELLFHSLHQDLIATREHATTTTCMRCQTEVIQKTYKEFVDGTDARRSTECPQCGPLEEVPVGPAAHVTTGSSPLIESGDVVLPGVAVSTRPLGAWRHVVLTVRDEMKGETHAVQRFRRLAVEPFREPLPELPDSPELHTVSAVVIQGPAVSVRQQRARRAAC